MVYTSGAVLLSATLNNVRSPNSAFRALRRVARSPPPLTAVEAGNITGHPPCVSHSCFFFFFPFRNRTFISLDGSGSKYGTSAIAQTGLRERETNLGSIVSTFVWYVKRIPSLCWLPVVMPYADHAAASATLSLGSKMALYVLFVTHSRIFMVNLSLNFLYALNTDQYFFKFLF